MSELSTDVRIFISSTFIDLKELREEIASRLREVFGARLLIMETFGSDEAPPEISSLRRVRESDVFIGIYARRYGTVDVTTGKSITELELDEAERSHSAGNLMAILLYWLADDAPWPARFCEKQEAATRRLSSLREHARQHTYTPFSDPSDLPFFVIRDVLAKIRHRLTPPSLQPRKMALPSDRQLQRPIGMEFLTSADRKHLYGRDEKIKELLERIDSNQITLLLGNSGSGKTSLIHAGLFPTAIAANWFPIYTRPLGLPRSDIVSGLLASVFEGPHSYRGALLTPLEQAASAVTPKRLLLIIDQFEDILTAREAEETERLVADLRTIRYLDDPRIRVLVSYRADLEARLGRFWQLISGSPEGLARVYVAGITALEAWKSTESVCTDLRITMALTEDEKAQMMKDLQSFSTTHGEEGVYPPYIQMLIDHVWRKGSTGSGSYRFDDYIASGAMDGVTAGYLARQLTFAHDTEGYLKSALVSLVRSYGVKAQKSLSEIAADMGIAQRDCEVVLEKLIDLRLVRHLTHSYEVAHDFLAREISAKLVDSEERDFKRLRELLSSKAATFSSTRSLLTIEELLLLFQYKERVLPSDGEVRLILASWVQVHGPGLYLLLGCTPSRLVEIIRAEEAVQHSRMEDEDRAMLALLRCKVGGSPLALKDWQLFRRYRLGLELVEILSTIPLECPDKILLWALRNRRRTVREAALEAVAKKIANGRRQWITLLSKSSSPFYRAAYERLAIRSDLPLFSPNSAQSSREFRQFGLVQRIMRATDAHTSRRSLKELKKSRAKACTLLFVRGALTQQNGSLARIMKRLSKLPVEKITSLLNGVRGKLHDQDFKALLDAYAEWNQREASSAKTITRRLRKIYEDKASAIAKAILAVATNRDIKRMRDLLPMLILTPSAQYYALALVGVGNSSDIVRIIKWVEEVQYGVRFWFQVEMGLAFEGRMKQMGEPIPSELLRICQKRGFWEDERGRRTKIVRKDKLNLRESDNRSLYLRLVAHAVIGASGPKDLKLLRQLTQHRYRMVAKAAAVRLVELVGDEGIRILQSNVSDAIERRNAEPFGGAIREAEIEALKLADLSASVPGLSS